KISQENATSSLQSPNQSQPLPQLPPRKLSQENPPPTQPLLPTQIQPPPQHPHPPPRKLSPQTAPSYNQGTAPQLPLQNTQPLGASQPSTDPFAQQQQ